MAVLWAAALLAAAPVSRPQSSGFDYGGLPEGEGRELVYGICSACHSTRLVMQQGLSRERWDHLLEWMREEQGMPALGPDTRDVVLDYLAEHFPEDRDTGSGGGRRAPTGIQRTPLPQPGAN